MLELAASRAAYFPPLTTQERLNAEDLEAEEARARLLASDVRLAIALVRASALPMLYPGGVLLLCWEGLRDL